MKRKSVNIKKILAVGLIAAMATTFTAPMGVFAADNVMVADDGDMGETPETPEAPESTLPTLESASVVKVSQSSVASENDKIILTFTAATNGPDNFINQIVDYDTLFGTGAVGEWDTDKAAYTITLGTSPSITVKSKIKFQTNHGLKDLAESGDVIFDENGIALSGSFGKVIQPTLVSATINKKTQTAQAQEGDLIVLVFSARTNGADIISSLKVDSKKNAFGTASWGEWDDTKCVYTIALGAGATVKDNSIIELAENSGLMDFSGNAAAMTGNTVNLAGTFGTVVEEKAKIVSAVAYSEGNSDYIKVGFNTKVTSDATNGLNDNQKLALATANPELGEIGTVTTTDNTITIQIGADATVRATDDSNTKKLDLACLNIKSKSSDTPLENATVAYTGHLSPIVTDVVAESGNLIRVKFSTRTNQSQKINLEQLAALYGEGAKANWIDAKTLVIHLGNDYGIEERGYITLDSFGIKDGYSGAYSVIGQYKIQSGSFTEDKLVVSSVIAASTKTNVITASKDDTITINFSHTTNAPAVMSDVITKVINKSGDELANPFGTDAQMNWLTNKTLQIKLGEAPEIEKDSKIYFNTDKIAKISGDKLSVESATVKGSFDGRDCSLSGRYIKTSGSKGDHQFKVSVDNTSSKASVKPVIVCVAYNGDTPVTISRVSSTIADTEEMLFTFAGTYTITEAKIYAFNNLFDDVNSAPSVLAQSVSIKTK